MISNNHNYVHGYSPIEGFRLADQARTLASLLHHGIRFENGARVLEAGCGIGAQTVLLAGNSPGARITSMDLSQESLREAQKRVFQAGFTNVSFQEGDITHTSFNRGSFDHIFLCFVLEHLVHPLATLAHLTSLLTPGGTITVIEGDHGSTFFYPHSEAAMEAIRVLIDMQAEKGGNALIGRELYPLLSQAGLADLSVEPLIVYVDASRPNLVDGFIEKTFTAMVAGVGDEAVSSGRISQERWDEGIRGLRRTKEKDGTFCYTFFRAFGRVSSEKKKS